MWISGMLNMDIWIETVWISGMLNVDRNWMDISNVKCGWKLYVYVKCLPRLETVWISRMFTMTRNCMDIKNVYQD